MEIFSTTFGRMQCLYYQTLASWNAVRDKLYDVLKEGDVPAIAILHQAIQERLQEDPLTSQQLSTLLLAKPTAESGLYWALVKGHAGAIHAYKELLASFKEKIEPEQLFELLRAKKYSGDKPGLHMALENGHADAIRAYKDLLVFFEEKITPEQVVELLMAKKIFYDLPGLHMALKNGHADAIHAYKELLVFFAEKMALEQLVELMVAKDHPGLPGLYIALQNGCTEAIDAYKELFCAIYEALSAEKQASCVELFFDALETLNRTNAPLLFEKLATDVQTLETYSQYKEQIAHWRKGFQQQETGQRNEENIILTDTMGMGKIKAIPIGQPSFQKAHKKQEKRDWSAAHRIYEKLVNASDVDREIKGEAAYRLGKMHLVGRNGIAQSEKQAIAWFEQAYQYSQQTATQAKVAFALGESYRALSIWSSMMLDKPKEELALEWYQNALSH